MKNREPKEPLFHYDNRILAYFGCDLYEAAVTTRLEKDKTFSSHSIKEAMVQEM